MNLSSDFWPGWNEVDDICCAHIFQRMLNEFYLDPLGFCRNL